jgi:selenocysteine lyase/cysteine desulfurase
VTPGTRAASRSPGLDEAFARFRVRNPEYEQTRVLDELRERDFARLDAQAHVYLDYTGSGLYGAAQVRRHSETLLALVLGNPHSASRTSLESTRLVEHCRERVLGFFRADPAEYVVVFTANASQALKLVGESYPFESDDVFLLTFDNHNSVNGIREFDRLHGSRTIYVPLEPPDLRVDEAVLERQLSLGRPGGHNLFAYPAQSNFSGVQHSLDWVERAQARGFDVLLDAAAFVPTNRLDLSRVTPDFVALSFYKMFGYPTGVGALLARRSALAKLHRPWFAGGTIEVASVQADRFVLASGAAGFEDGTVDFANIPAVELGLDLLDSVSIEVVHTRVSLLTAWLLERLLSLRHAGGRPLVHLYGPPNADRRGGTLAFNFYDAGDAIIDHRVVEQRASERGISLRTGCFCNPGAGELALGLSRGELEACFASVPAPRMTWDDLRLCVDPKAAGAVRVSLGLVSNFPDAYAFGTFAEGFVQGWAYSRTDETHEIRAPWRGP